MASGIDRLNKLISKDAEKKAEEKLEARYGTYSYDKDAKGFTKTNTVANNNSAANKNNKTNASSSTRNTGKTNGTVSRNASGVERLNKLISSDAEKKAEEKLSKRYGSYSYDKERNGYTKTEVAKAASIPTYTPTADRKSKEEVEALRNRRDEIDKKLKQLNAEYYNYQDNTAENKWLIDDWAEKNGIPALEAEYEALGKELEAYKYDDYLEDVYDNTFTGRFKANYGQGRLSQDSSAAWNEYLENPTEENMQKALYIDYALEQFANNNAETLGEDGWVSKSFAGYAPQLIDQATASAKGAGVAVGGALALNATGVLAGLPEEIVTVPFAIKAGIIGGSGKYSYDTMRGAAFRELIMAGVDENTARAAANDEAVVSALIEMADTGFDIMTLGVGSLIKNVGKFGIKNVTKQFAKEGSKIAAEKALKRFALGLGKYGLNIAGEGVQEATQEVISMANEQRALEGNTGKLDLIGSAWDKAQNLTPEEAAQVKEAAKEGMKISAMIGGATAATTGVTNRAIEARNNRVYSNMGATFSETETVDDVIATGLESAPETESYKLAEKLQAKREAGEIITDREVGKLYAENVKTIREEETAASQQEVENQPSESFETSDDNLINELQKVAQETTQKVAEGSNAIYTASDKFMNEAARAMAEMEQQRNELKFTDAVKRFGDNGAKALGSYYDNQSNFDDYYNGFSRFYEAGSVGLPMEQVNTVYSRNISPAVQQAAYMAGVNDAKVSLERDVAGAKVYFPEGKLVQNEYSKQLSKDEVSFYSNLSKITGNKIEFVGANMIGGGLADGSYLNGYVNAEIGTEEARRVVISHEITHGFQDTSPVQYRAYRDYAVKVAERANGSDTSIVEQYRQRYKTTIEKAKDEVAADFTRALFTDRKEMQKFIEANIHDKKSRSMVQKFFDAVNDFVQKIKKALKGNKAKMNEAAVNEFGVTVAELEQARQLWLDALKSTKKAVDQAKARGVEESSVAVKDINNSGVIAYDEKTESVHPQFSLKTWNDTDKERTIKALQKVLGKSKEEVEKYLDAVNGVAKYIANHKILDYESSSVYTAMKSNDEYKYTIDFSTLCKKRLLQTGTIDAIQHRLPNTILTGDDYVRIRQMMKDKGYEVACGLCYVESRRKELDTMAAKFIDEYKGGKNNLNIDDLTTTDGLLALMQNDEATFNDFIKFNNKRGSGKVNLVETRVEYNGEILGLSKKMVDTLNAAGGLRVQSYSDFEVVHLIDMMQVALDMSEKGLMSQAYTKVPAFAEVMGNTGMKINLSLIAKGVGYDAKGNLLFDDVEGMPFKTAMKLRNKFSENVGTILVGINDRHIELAMADDRIDYIIPYHRSGWANREYEALGISGYENYSDTQNEKWKEPYMRDKNGEVIYDSKGKPKKRPLHNIHPSEYWDYSKTGDENAQRYLELCEEMGRTPKFPQFAGKEGYWKLLIDFKMYDNDGVGAPQRTVTPEFDTKAIDKIMKDYVKGEPMSANKLPVAKDIVDEFVAEYESQPRYSLKDSENIEKEAKDVIRNLKLQKLKSNAGYFNFASYTTERINREIEYSSAKGDPDSAKAYIAWVSPSDFLFATTGDRSTRNRIAEEAGELDLNELANQTQPIYLNVDMQTNEIVGHEGRHRMSALEKAGIDKVAVIIQMYNQPTPKRLYPMRWIGLKGQRFDEYFKGSDFSVTDLLPLSNRYADTAREMFSEIEGYYGGVRFSLKDSDYMKAVNSGDMRAAQKMVDEAAEMAGYTMKVYHGTNTETINEFTGNKEVKEINGLSLIKGFFSDDEKYSEGFGDNVFVYFMDTSNFIGLDSVYTPEEMMEQLESKGVTGVQFNEFISDHKSIEDWFYEIGYEYGEDLIDVWHFFTYSGGNITERIAAAGYKGVAWDEGFAGYAYMPFDSGLIKSADPVVYDANGNVIPLSKRFDSNESDIRFSRKDTSDILKQNARLKEYNDYLKEQMKLTKELKLDKKALEKMARSLIKEYDSNMDATELYDKLNGVYSYLLNTEQPIWEELKSRAVAVARDIVSDATVVNDELYQSYSNLRNYLRTVRITLSDVDKRSFPDGFNEFRRANFGRINLVNNGSPVDSIYQELAEMHPELFDAERYTNPAEQLEHIAEVLDSLRPYEENPYSYYMNEATELLANDIIERYYDVPQVKPTFADKQQQKLDKQKYKGAVKLAELKEKNKEQIEKIKAQSKDRAKQLIEKERAKKKDAIDKLKAHQKEKEANMSDKRKRSVLRSKIINHINPMREKLLRPSDKNHVPQEMRITVAALLDAINLESGYTYDPKTGGYRKSDAGLPTRRTQELERLKKQYQEILGTDAGADMVIDPSLLGDTVAGIGSNLDKLIDMRDIRLADMTLEQLNTVWEVVRAVEASIFYAGRMLAQQKYETTSSFANAFANDTETRKNRKSFGSKRISLDLENPYTFFSHFGQAGKDFFRMLRNAQDEAKLIDIELAERMREVASSEQRKSLEKDLQKFTTVGGDELTLSKAHIMNIYLLSKRPQAEGHLLRGGIVQPEINRKIHRGTDAVQLTAQDLNELFKLLTPEERKIADGLQKLTLFLAEKGNEATMKVYGYEKFTDPNYWTIKSAKEGLLQTVEEGQDLARSIRNMGSAKQTVPNASNPLEIGSAFEVFDAHASDMITYSVWLAPMEDSTRLFNFRFRDAGENLTGKTMKGLLNRVGGAGGDSYWMNLMRDIQNGISSPADDVMSTVINKTIGGVKKAAVAGNIRVIVQQPTAYLRAMVVLSPADLIAGVAKELSSGVTRNGGWKKAVKYAPIAAIKQAGGFEVSANPAQLSEALYSPNTKKGKVVQFIKDLPFAGASAADAVTWGAIWNACETQVARTNKDLAKDSDGFNKAVKELFTEVIDQSQVVDGVLQRSQIMRSSNALNKQATSYMGEPTTALNMFMRCYDAWVNETSPEKRLAALKNIGRAAVALMASNVVVAIAQSSVDALRDDEEDKEYLERFMAALTGITGDEETLLDIGKNIVLSGNIGNQMNPATYIPYVKDIVSILQGYTVERMDTGVYSDLISATENVMKSFNGEGKWTKGYAVAKMLTIGAKLFGSSSANVMRDIESIVRSLFIETDDWQALYDMEKQMYDVNKQKSRFLDILYQAMKAGDTETYNAIVTDLIDEGVKPSDIKNGMSSRAKKDEEVSTEATDFDSTLAGLGLKYNYVEEEEAEEEKFTVDNLSGDEYVRYNEVSTEMLENIISDLQYYGLGDLDEETANALINAAYSYVNNVALEDASGGEYEIDTKWITAAKEADDELGLSIAEYIMLKEEYGASALTTEGIFTAYNAGVDPELYLEVKDNINDMKAEKDADGKSISGSKKNKVIEYLNTLGLTEEEYGALMEAAGYKNPFE